MGSSAGVDGSILCMVQPITKFAPRVCAGQPINEVDVPIERLAAAALHDNLQQEANCSQIVPRL